MPAQGQNIIELGFDVASLDAQKKRVLDILLEVYEAAKKIDGTQLKPISLPGFSDLKTQTDAQKKAVDELSISVKEYSSIQNQRAQTEAKVAAAGSDAAKQLAEQKVQLQQVNKENKEAALAALGLTGAYKELSNQFRQASAEAKNLAAQAIIDPKFSEQAKQAAAVANELNNKLKTIDASVGDFRRNVGNYSGAIAVLEKGLQDVKNKMDQLTQSGQQNSSEFEALNKQYGLLEVLTSQQAKGFASLTQEIRTGERQLQTLSSQGLENTEVFRQLRGEVTKAAQSFKDFQRQEQLLETEAPTLEGLVLAARGLGGAYAVGAGAAALFGGENARLEKELNQLVAIMTILQGLQEFYKLLQERTAIATALNTTATNVAVAAQKLWQATALSSIAATVAFRIALIGLTGGLLLLLPLLALGASSMNSIKDAQHDAELQQRALNDVNAKASEQYADQIVKLQSLKARFEETNATAKTKKEVTEELNKAFGEYGVSLKDASETEKFLKDQAGDFITMLSLKTKATAALALATDQYKKVLKDQTQAPEELVGTGEKIRAGIKSVFSDMFDTSGKSALELFKQRVAKAGEDTRGAVVQSDKEMYDQLLKLSEDYQNQADALSGKTKFGSGAKPTDDKKAEDAAKKEAEATFQLAKLREQIEADSYKKIADDQSKSLVDRLKALNNYAQLEADIINKSAQHEIEINKLTGNQALLVREKALQDIKTLNESVSGQAIGISQQTIDAARAQADQFRSEQAEKAEQAKNDKLAKEKELQDGIIALGDETNNSVKQHLKDEEKAEADSAKKKLEIRKQLREKETELASQIVDLTATLITAGYEREKNAIQQVEDANNERFSTEITNIQNSTLSEQDKANKITVLQAQQHQQQLQFDKQKRDLQTKEARVEKAKNVAEIIINTSRAVVEALPNIPLSVVIGAIGAVELAKVLATPIPQYAEGTDSHPGGLAVVGEGKHNELVQMPGGISFVADKPMLLDLPLNTKVLPLTDDINEMANRAMIINTARMLEFKERDNNVSKMLTQTNKILSAIAKKETNIRIQTHTKVDLGWTDYLKKNVYGK